MHVGVSYTDEQEIDVEEDDFLVRSDVVSLSVFVPDKVLEILFDLDFEQTSEQTIVTMVDEDGNAGTDLCSETYAVSDRQSVIEILLKFLADSFLETPCRNSTEMNAKLVSAKKEEHFVGEATSVRVSEGEEHISFGGETMESPRI